jgi:peptidoglycan/LPS O-acetylase OafA/YrhL
MERKTIPELDGLRGAAILLVFVNHFVAPSLKGTHGVQAAVYAVTRSAWSGVDLFFVLSGFLITGILLDTKGQTHYWRNYAARRFLRIFPLYYGVLFALFVLVPALHWQEPAYAELRAHQAWYWTYLVNVLVALKGEQAAPLNTVHFWSLCIEEQFYCVWPFVVLLASRRRLLQIAAGTAIVGGAVRVATIHGLGAAAAYTFTPGRLDGLMAGAVVAVIARGPAGLLAWRDWAWRAVAVGGAALVALGIWHGGLAWDDPAALVVGLPLLALVCAALLVLAVTTHGRWPRLLRAPYLRACGRYSYGLYVFHYPLLWAVDYKLGGLFTRADALVPGSALPGMLLRIAITVPLCFGLALASYHWYEKRFLTLKQYFADDAIPRSPAAEAESPHAAIHPLAAGARETV